MLETITLFYIITIIAIILLCYTVFKYFNHPRRKLLKAKHEEEFYLFDHFNDVNKNIEFTYKGCLFAGEKYLGYAENKFRVVSLQVTVSNPVELLGITKNDLSILEEKLHLHYPNIDIIWKYPINQILVKQNI